MSRIGKRVLTIPAGVTVTETDKVVSVKGPKGELSYKHCDLVDVIINENTLTVTRKNDSKEATAMHGTTNALINNMMIGVSEGYQKELEAVGVGYRFNVQGKKIVVSAGYSHPVEVMIPENLTVESPSNTELIIKGYEKQAVSEFAANIRKIREPEPYKGKGIKYKDEHIRRKEGKKAA